MPVLGASLVAFAMCLVFLSRAYLAQTYVYLPLLRELTEAREAFLEFAQVMAEGETEVLQEFHNEFRRRIISAADANTESNERRSKFLHWARITLLWVLALTFLSGAAFVVDQVENRIIHGSRNVQSPGSRKPTK